MKFFYECRFRPFVFLCNYDFMDRNHWARVTKNRISFNMDWLIMKQRNISIFVYAIFAYNKGLIGINSNFLTIPIRYFHGTCRKTQCHVDALTTRTHFVSGEAGYHNFNLDNGCMTPASGWIGAWISNYIHIKVHGCNYSSMPYTDS